MKVSRRFVVFQVDIADARRLLSRQRLAIRIQSVRVKSSTCRFPLARKKAVSKMIRSMANFGKSPLSRPFGYAQGMLFQRGTRRRKRGITKYLQSKSLSSWIIPPLKKGGRGNKGDLNFSLFQGGVGNDGKSFGSAMAKIVFGFDFVQCFALEFRGCGTDYPWETGKVAPGSRCRRLELH